MKHCLVLDDSDVIRKVACHILGDLRIHTTEADSGVNALEQCNLKMPDAVLVDWLMPEMSGVDFIASLSEIDKPMPYVIYCTTENNHDDITRAINAGASDYMLKPIDRETVKAKMREAGLA